MCDCRRNRPMKETPNTFAFLKWVGTNKFEVVAKGTYTEMVNVFKPVCQIVRSCGRPAFKVRYKPDCKIGQFLRNI